MNGSLLSRWRDIQSRVDSACGRSGRLGSSVRVVAVTKAVSVSVVHEAVELGIREFGENRVQEASPKIEAMGRDGLSWHFIGRIQGNKLRKVIGQFDWVQSAGDAGVLSDMERVLAETGVTQNVLIQVSAGGEEDKAGFSARDALEYFVSGRFRELRFVRLRGLMGIAPNTREERAVRKFFVSLRECREACGRHCPDLRELSMGMSQDFEWAIEEGATIVRIGTALFGPRA